MPDTDEKVDEKAADAAADAGGDDTASADADTKVDDDKGAADLGDAGKKALDRMKLARNTERDKRKALETELATLRAKPAGDDDKPDVEAIQRNADVAAQKKASERILRSEVKAAAAGKLADPADAYKFLDLSQFEVDADGNVDETEVADAIDDLIKSKPYLASVQDGKRFKGTADGGTRKETRPSQLTQADIGRMSPQAIEEARVAGRLSDLMSGKNS